MRKRWEINTEACIVAAIIWMIAGLALTLATLTDGDPNVQGDGTAHWWALVAWFGPFALAGCGAALYGFWRWFTSHNGWLIRRVPEPIRTDLRELND